MEPEGSVLCSQKPAAGPYPEPDTHFPQYFMMITFIFNNFVLFFQG
jgi:hypothetical protein